MTSVGHNRLLDILRERKIISEQEMKRVLEARKISGKSFSAILVEDGYVSEKDIAGYVSEASNIPILNLSLIKVSPAVIKLVPKRIADRHKLIPVSKIANMLTVAMADPTNVFAVDDLKEITGCIVRPVIATQKDISAAFDTYYSDTAHIEDLFQDEDIDVDSIEVVRDREQTEENAMPKMAEEAPVIRMVNLILQEAIKRRASDIHFEPYERQFRIRYRIDGVLKEAFSPPRQMYASLLARLKIVSDLDITEKRLPQDGRFKAKFEEREIDFRVSLLPTYHGEKAVLRILDKRSLQVGLTQLGFLEENVQTFQDIIKRPYGMVLVTGPTGSGKSTTLYSILNQINTKDRNIMTIEDPVEYQVEGITQTQVNPDIGLTFAGGLRSLLRQSPDVILVGEIRDSETADIAVKAALTGHLLFSTLHTNTACTAITRLTDMGIEPFLIASSLVAATAQRLLRKTCEKCKEPYEIPESVFTQFQIDPKQFKGVTPYHGRGCSFCNQTGYKGRIATMEIFVMDEEFQQMVIERKSSDEIEVLARKKGMKTLFENALQSFIRGSTTLEEVLRVTSEG